MPRPVFDHLWGHESYQAPLPSDRVSDILQGNEKMREKLTKIPKHMFCCPFIRSNFKSR